VKKSGAGVFRAAGRKSSSAAGKRASAAVIILANCLRTHSPRINTTHIEHKGLVGGAEQAVCAINPGAQNFHSPAHLYSVGAAPD
jgi:hypothetical protein